jgi:hypothetical protein
MGILAAGLGLLLVPFLLPIPAALERNRALRALGSQLHVPLMAAVCLLLYRLGPLARRFWLAGAVTAVLGTAIEFLQQRFGRHPRWQDVLVDLVGIGLVACWVWWRKRRTRWAMVAGLILLAVIPFRLRELPFQLAAQRLAALRFPLLADFETRTERALWSEGNTGRYRFVRRGEGAGEGWALEVIGRPPETFPGAEYTGFPADWSAYDVLEWEARSPGIGPLDSVRFGLRVDDASGLKDGVWTARRFHTGADWRRYQIELTGLRAINAPREMQLDDIAGFLFYLPRPDRETVLQVDNIRLR